MNVTANVQRGLGTVRVNSKVDGFGDLTVIPAMLAWKSGEWQFNALLPIYAPTGSYEQGRLGNPGLNYWTFDPIVGVVYSSRSGLNALLHAGYAMNTENSATNYKSGSLLHFDGAIQQILPVGLGIHDAWRRRLLLPAGHLRQRIRRRARMLQGPDRRPGPGARLHPAARQAVDLPSS